MIMPNTVNFDEVNQSCAGIDVGAEKIFVSPDGIEVKSFDTFTSGYYLCIELNTCKAKTLQALPWKLPESIGWLCIQCLKVAV